MTRKQYLSHRHQYKLVRRHHHPQGYLFSCDRCVKQNMYPFHFIRLDSFWGRGKNT